MAINEDRPRAAVINHENSSSTKIHSICLEESEWQDYLNETGQANTNQPKKVLYEYILSFLGEKWSPTSISQLQTL